MYALCVRLERLLVLGTALVLATVGIVLADVALSNPTSSAETQLKAALKATFDASSWVSTDSKDVFGQTIFNAPNSYETLDNGRITTVSVGANDYEAVPTYCTTGPRFIQTQPAGSFDISFGVSQGERVDREGSTFIVTNEERDVERYRVQGGFVTAVTRYFRFPGKVEAITDSYQEIGHAPRIAAPPANTVVMSPKVYSRGCPL